MLCGGFKSTTENIPPEVSDIASSFRADIQAMIRPGGADFIQFDCIQYTTQVVAGTNYKMKINIGGSEYVHIKVFKPLPHTNQPPELSFAEVAGEADPL